MPIPLTAAHITGMWLPGSPQVSPDGHWVAFAVRATSRPKKRRSARAAIWLAPVDGSTPARQLTSGVSRDFQPRWSPDGRWLAFLSDRVDEDKNQLYRLALAGGEAERLTDWTGGIEEYAWSPDGARIAFTARDQTWEKQNEEREESGDDPDVWGDRLGYRRLRVLDLDTRRIDTLGPDDRHATEFAWSPDGRELAVAYTLRPDLDAEAELGVDIVRVPVDGGALHHAGHTPFGANNLGWTRDGEALLYRAWESGTIPSSHAVWRLDVQSGERRCLSTRMQGCVIGLARPAGSHTLLLAVAEGLTTRVYDLDPDTGTRTLRYAPPAGTSEGEIGADEAGRVLAVVCSTGTTPPELFAGDPAAGLTRVSDCNPALREIRWAEQEPFTWTAPDGLALDGLLLRPTEAQGTPPGVVLVHGGPYGRFADGFNCSAGAWAQWLAQDGYAVFLPNPRGGAGHGHDFAATVAGEVGMADWCDVASGADAFVQGGHADGDRLGIGGWSQGGFMTDWAVTGGIPAEGGARGWSENYSAWRPGSIDRFRTGVAGAGPSDWGAMTAESDVPTFEAMLGGSRLGDGVGPHRHAVVSPISYANRAHTPLLLLHGRNDERVPAGQAIGFFHELRLRGVPVEMVLYPREPHGIGEEAHQHDMLGRVREWYGKWLRG